MASEESKPPISPSCFDDNFDPFAQGVVSKEANGNDDTSTDTKDLQSKNYLATLETKLSLLKGKTTASAKNLNSKDMLKSLHQAKEDAIKRLTANDTPVVTDTILDSRDDIEVGDFKRRMFPEQALNAEEIQTLTERDYLGTLVQNLQEEQKSKAGQDDAALDT
ncbi:uncharacterized protein [Amphiura filiformis]|uniref:uncharacterized protein n=1 Tax=Amphiura filiformis TaxID=82378 RepID=UPI003B222DAA